MTRTIVVPSAPRPGTRTAQPRSWLATALLSSTTSRSDAFGSQLQQLA
jgi:hypothetical protein